MPVDDASKLEVSEELLMRQVHPNMMQEGRLWSGAFTPTASDLGQLSADREAVITPKAAYEKYLAMKGLAIAGGTFGVTIAEFKELDLAAYADALPDSPAHALVNFGAHPEDKHKGLGKLAYNKANARRRLFPEIV